MDGCVFCNKHSEKCRTDVYKRQRLQSAGWNLDNLSDAQKIAISLDISSFFDTFEKMPKYMRDFFNEKTLEEEFNIKINAEYTEPIQSLSDLQKKFNEATDGQFEAQIKVSTDSEKIIEGIQKAYKEAKETTNQLKPVLILSLIHILLKVKPPNCVCRECRSICLSLL